MNGSINDISFQGVFDSRHLGLGAREGGSKREKLTQVFETTFVTRLILSPLAERSAPIDRLARNVKSEPCSVAEGFGENVGKCDFAPYQGTKADLNTGAQEPRPRPRCVIAAPSAPGAWEKDHHNQRWGRTQR